MAIIIPYKPRSLELHEKIESKRFIVLVAHRRFGKTVLSVNHLIKKALCNKLERGSYAYVAPFRNQAKEIAWSYLKHYTSTIPQRETNESDLSITLPNGSRIRIFGADNPDALRGLYFDGVVLDEVAQMKPEVWEEIIQPALADRKGWTLFIGTPKGINVFSELYNKATYLEREGNPDWCAMSFPVTETTSLDPEEVDRLQRELSENAWKQEMMCDFNASSDDVLIPLNLVVEAMGKTYKPEQYKHSPIVLGVDVADYGDDCSVIIRRQGLVCFEPIILKKADNMVVAGRVAQEIDKYNPSAVFIDAGAGSGVISRLRELGYAVQRIPFGASASNPIFANKRMEMWHEIKAWLEDGGCLPPNEIIKGELTAPTYKYNSRGLLLLEPKEDIKDRIGRSPDIADALALTFAAPVCTTEYAQQAKTSYDVLAYGV